VLLVDDDALWRRGLRHLLSGEGIEVAAEVQTGDLAVVRCGALRPDVVLLGLVAGSARGLDTLRRMRAVMPDVPVIAVAASRDPADLFAALSSESCGLLTKDARVPEIVAALRSAAAGGVFLSAAVAPSLLSQVRATLEVRSDAAGAELLSERENDVLLLMAQGMENAAIAGELSITVRTVKAHVSSILDKLGVENRVQAAVMASRWAGSDEALPTSSR
jgi:DNA-binding NarL/FixJ family response regulator